MLQHHRLSGLEFEQILGYSAGQRSLACCSLWGCKEFNMTDLATTMIQQFYYWTYTQRKPHFKETMHPSVHCSTSYNIQDMEVT